MASNASTQGAGTGNHVVGKVIILYGTVKAQAPDGTVRVLSPNSVVFADERIITESDGQVSIMLDGPPPTQMDLGRMSDVLLNEDVYAGVTPDVVADASTDAEKIQQTLLEGDQPIDLEATAAGGAAGAGGGHPTVNFSLTGEEVIPGSGAPTTGGELGIAGPIQGIGAPDGMPSITPATTDVTLDDEGLAHGIRGGIGDVDGEEIVATGTLPHDFGPDGAGSVTFASMDGTAGTLGVEAVTYSWDAGSNTLTASSARGELFSVEVDPATGHYELTMFQNILHEAGGDENNALANLTYTVMDADGDAVTGTLAVNFNDDTPVLLGSGTGSEGTTGQDTSISYTGIPGPGEGGSNLINNLGGEHGFGEAFLPGNDDGSTGFIDVSSIFPDGMKLFGQTYDGFYINNNGNITFEAPMSTFTPFAITGDTANPMIAPFFADIDTRGGEVTPSAGGTSTGSNLVWYDFDQANGVITITWDDVGYYGSHTDHTDAFQLRIFNQGDGNFSFEFRYENMDWTTGDASGGSGGLGGVIARAGWTAGDGVNYYELPQSGDQAGMLGLETTSNPDTALDGNWVFNVLNGEIHMDGGSDTVGVEDEKAPGGLDEIDDGGVGVVTGTIVDNVNWGADGFGSVTEIKVGELGTFTVEADGSTTVFWAQDGTFQGTDSEGAAASLLVNSDGTYTYTLLDNLLLGQDTQGEQIDHLATVSITGQDADGDPISVNVTLQVQDDVPQLLYTEGGDNIDSITTFSDGSDTVTVEDEHVSFWTNEPWDGGHGHVDGTIVDNVNWGADGFGSVTQVNVGELGTFTVVAGESTTVYWAQDGTFLGTNDGDAHVAASLVVNSDGTYTFNLLDNLLLGQDIQGEQIDHLATVSITGQDADGDTVAVNVTLNVQDDIPSCFTLPDIVAVEDEHLSPFTNEWFDGGHGHVTGTIVNNTFWGADGFGEVSGFNVGESHFEAGATVYWAQNGDFLGASEGEGAPEGAAASLEMNSDGSYTYNLLDNLLLGEDIQGEQIDHLATVSITGQDADGDLKTVNVTLNVQDDVPSFFTLPDIVAVEDESIQPGGNNEHEWPIDGVGHVDGTIVNNALWGADGFGEVAGFNVGESHFEAGATVYWAQNGDFLGENEGEAHAAASLEVNSDGTYTYNLLDNLLLGEDIQGEQIDHLATVSITGQDADGDLKTVNVNLNVQDDVPSFFTLPDIVAVEDEQMPGGNDEADGGVSAVNGTIVNNTFWGADGFDSATSFTVDQQSYSAGTTVYWAQNGEFLGTDNDDAAASLVVNSDGTYTYNLLDNLLLGQSEQGEQIDHLATVSITGRDADGDLKAVNVNLNAQDDIPVLYQEGGSDTVVIEDEQAPGGINEDDGGVAQVLNGSIVDNVSWGADGFAGVGAFTVGASAFNVAAGGSTTVYWAQNGHFQGTLSVDAAASLTVNSNGTYNYNLIDNLLLGQGQQGEQTNTLDTVSIIGQDGDGDMKAVNVTLQVTDDMPTAGLSTAATLDDEGQPYGIPGGVGDVTGELSQTSGILAHAFGADGAGSIDFAAMNGLTGTVGTETVSYTWNVDTHTLTATSERGDLFTVHVDDETTGAYTVTQLDNVLHDVEHDPVTVNPGNYQSLSDMVSISVYVPGDGNAALNVNNNGGAAGFGITSSVDGTASNSYEINHLIGGSEVMTFALQQGMAAHTAAVTIEAFYANEGSVGNEVGAYELYNDGILVQSATAFAANSSNGHFTLNIGYDGGFDEIRFSALSGTSDPSGGDSSDYNIQAITFDEIHQSYENDASAALTYTVTDSDGDHVDGALNLTFDDDMPVAHNLTDGADYTTELIPGETITQEFAYDADNRYVVGSGGDEDEKVVHANNDMWGITESSTVTELTGGGIQIEDTSSASQNTTAVSIPAFDVAAGETTISFDVDVLAKHSGDTFSWEVYKWNGSDWQSAHSGTQNSDGQVTHTWTDDTGGTYRLVFEVNDKSSGSDKFTVTIDDIKVTTTTPDTYEVHGEPVQGHLDASFGADGGHIASIAAVDTTHADNTSADGHLQVTGEYGGVLEVDSTTGDYVYTPPTTAPAHDVTEKFSFTVIDGDGDMASAQLSMLIDAPDDHHGPC